MLHLMGRRIHIFLKTKLIDRIKYKELFKIFLGTTKRVVIHKRTPLHKKITGFVDSLSSGYYIDMLEAYEDDFKCLLLTIMLHKLIFP